MKPNSLYYGDCLDWMRKWNDECVDLIYLDPPFNSSANYNILFGTAGDGKAQYRAFNDTWHWDAAAVRRYDRFKRASARPAHKAVVGLWHMLGECGMLAYLTYMAERLEEMRRILKPTGSIYLHCDPTASHALKLLMDAIFGRKNFRNEIVWKYGLGGSSKRYFSRKHDTLLYYSKSKNYYFDKPLEDATSARMRGQKKGMSDVWQIPSLNNMAKERTGYPTQKPLALLERIIKASSNEGDLVLDPFCGCGTAMAAARGLNRRYVGIDISSFAIDLVRKRLKDEAVQVAGIPADLASARKLAKEKPFDFESWAVTRLAGFAPNTRQVADGGVDGRGMVRRGAERYVYVRCAGRRYNPKASRTLYQSELRQ